MKKEILAVLNHIKTIDVKISLFGKIKLLYPAIRDLHSFGMSYVEICKMINENDVSISVNVLTKYLYVIRQKPEVKISIPILPVAEQSTSLAKNMNGSPNPIQKQSTQKIETANVENVNPIQKPAAIARRLGEPKQYTEDRFRGWTSAQLMGLEPKPEEG